jgi:hypothetical protein
VRNRPRAQDRLIDALASAFTDFRFCDLAPGEGVPDTAFANAAARLSIRLFWRSSQKPVQDKARKGQRHPDARKSFP